MAGTFSFSAGRPLRKQVFMPKNSKQTAPESAKRMTDRWPVGTLLIKDGTVTPQPLQFATPPGLTGWSTLADMTPAQLGKQLDNAGWMFFHMAGGNHANGFGLNAGARMNHALAHVIASTRHAHCNCLEITHIQERSFLGLRYLSLSARSRHIQQSCSFQEPPTLSTNKQGV